MLRISQRTVLLTAAAASLVAACTAGSDRNLFSSTSSGGNQTGTGHGGGGTGNGDTTSDFTLSITNAGGGGSTSTGTTSGVGCPHQNDPAAAHTDGDGDGWTPAEGDCNDCDPNVNPGAIDVLHENDGGPPEWGDESCDGIKGSPDAQPCDSNLALDDQDPKNGARAIDLCKFTVENPANKYQKTWGVIDAQYTAPNGAPWTPPFGWAKNLQVGIMDSFGSNVKPQGGQKMFVMSSGHARIPGQPDACGNNSCWDGGPSGAPPNFPQDVPGCLGASDINDAIALQVKIRTPTNATGYRFAFDFYTFEYPEWVCTDYNDQFIALVSPPPTGSINGNISFDSHSNPVSVNIAFFNVCPGCALGTGQLDGTGFDGAWGDNAGATGWLTSQAPIKGGDVITIRFAIWDTGDQAWDSTALVDHFQWIANGGSPTPVQTCPALCAVDTDCCEGLRCCSGNCQTSCIQ